MTLSHKAKFDVLSRLLFLSACILGTKAGCVQIFVSPSGSDTNDGMSESSPVQTLHHAVSLLATEGIRGNDVFVELMGGYYYLPSTLQFSTVANGTVTLRAFQGQEVHVVGGQPMAASAFQSVTDPAVLDRLPQEAHSKVLALDLQAEGITDLGTLTTFGFYKKWKAPLEIFINGKPLRLAQWPNEDFINILSVPDGSYGRRFTYESGGRDTKWAQETEPWVYGWWYWGWADSSLPVSSVDPVTHTITLDEDSQYGLRVGEYNSSVYPPPGYNNQGGYFRVINMLSELDQPGEYFVDRINQTLYVWPNTPQQTLTTSDLVYLTTVTPCIKIDKDVHTLQFEDFTVEGCRQYVVESTDGSDITFKNMELKNSGSFGFRCSGDCRRVSILASNIHDTGGGIQVTGGDLTTLTSSEIVIRDNHIYDHARYGAQSNDAVNMNGVGVLVSHNHIHHGQYTGIRWTGNDHIMEYNHIHHECWNSSDCGAIHSGRDWTWRGNVIRHNYIHHTLRFHPGASVRGIMLDDEYSSALIENNVFYHNEVHMNIGGGRDNVVRNNVMYNATKYSIQVDGRGLGSSGHGTYLRDKLAASPYQTPLWQSRYPELYNILSKHPEAPEGNEIYKNVFYNDLGIDRVYYSTSNGDLQRSDYFDVHTNFKSYEKTDFWAPDDGDFWYRCEVEEWASLHQVSQLVTLSQVGPTVPTGPSYLRAQMVAVVPTHCPAPLACGALSNPPAPTSPRGAYLPDGSSPNTLYPDIPDSGCWFVVDYCPNAPGSEGTYSDTLGTQNGTEEGCLGRAAQQWHDCGSPSNGTVTAIYGKTGAMTIAGEGCFFAEWGKYCGLDDPGFHRDNWGENNVNAANDENACLSRAGGQWPYCGSDPNKTYTSMFRPTGAFRTAGAGCWIKIPSCPANVDLEGFFYDAWGATNAGTDTSKSECFDRAEYFWIRCGSHASAPVTAFYRPNAASFTWP